MSLPQPLATGHAAVDAYLADGFDRVRGMSSRFATAIIAQLMLHQTTLGIGGDVAEIGTFEGRLFVAMGLTLAPGEQAYGFDLFTWPDDKVAERLAANAGANGLPAERYVTRHFNSGDLSARDFSGLTGRRPLRLIHIDGDHSLEALAHDLMLAQDVLHRQGLIVLDDMLHPGYPFLVVAVHEHLKKHPDMRVMAVIDREDIVGAPKFVLCRTDAVVLYERYLMERYAPYHFVLGGDAMGHHCVVLTPNPRLADV